MIEIYGAENCTLCKQAKILCKMKSVEFVYKEAGVDYDLSEVKKTIPETHRSLPIVFSEGVYLGGLPELKAKLN